MEVWRARFIQVLNRIEISKYPICFAPLSLPLPLPFPFTLTLGIFLATLPLVLPTLPLTLVLPTLPIPSVMLLPLRIGICSFLILLAPLSMRFSWICWCRIHPLEANNRSLELMKSPCYFLTFLACLLLLFDA